MDQNPKSSLPIIAVFDFDGTLTRRDTLLPFLIFTTGLPKTYAKLLLLLPWFLGFLLGLISRQSTKEAVLGSFFKGISIQELQEKGKQFASQRLPQLILDERLNRLKWHLQQGHRCILISANLEIYLDPWAKQEGFQEALCSRLQVNPKQKITGKLEGLNCWGSEKTRRLEALLGPKSEYILYAYGDSRGDRELLALADYPFYRRFS